MPISIGARIRRLSQQEFGDISYDVMRHAFDIHNELGRFFDEQVYKRELARRLPSVSLEVPIEVDFSSFHASYHLDVLVAGGAVFEFKAVESLAPKHRAQPLNYLLLCDLAHGKLVNFRPETVEHEFVNTQWTRRARTRFQLASSRWNGELPGAAQLFECLVGLLRDIGAGLEVSLYESAVVQCFGEPERVEEPVAIQIDGHSTGVQRMRLISPGIAFKITAFDGPLDSFEVHARRLLQHVDLRAIAWINVNMKQVTFTTLER